MEIEYALGNLDSNKVYAWTGDDRKVSATMQEYFANFIKTGDPNGPGLPRVARRQPRRNRPAHAPGRDFAAPSRSATAPGTSSSILEMDAGR